MTKNPGKKSEEKKRRVLEDKQEPDYCEVCSKELDYYRSKQYSTCSKYCGNKLQGDTKRKNKLLRGRRNPNWKGYLYKTPAGIFETAEEASKYLQVSVPTIRRRCKLADIIIKPNYQIPVEYSGKTWREVGYCLLEIGIPYADKAIPQAWLDEPPKDQQ